MKKNIVLTLLMIFGIASAQMPQYDYFPMYTFMNNENFKQLEKAFFLDFVYTPESYSNLLADIRDERYPKKNDVQENKNGTTIITTYLAKGYYAKTPFRNNVADGVKVLYNSYDNVVQEIPYKKGKINGTVKTYNDSNQLFSEINYKDGLKNGIKKVIFSDDRRRYSNDDFVIEGNYVNGKLTDRLTITTGKIKILYPSDFKKGKVDIFMDNALWMEYSIIEENVKHGEFKSYTLNEAAFKNNVKQLEVSANYYMGDFNGWIEKYDKKSGKLLDRNLFRYGKPVGEQKYYNENGKLTSEVFYDDKGTKIGTWKAYNGDQLYSVTSYENGKLNGIKQQYYNGRVNSKETYKDGVKNGLTQYFGNDGKLKSDAWYDNNEFIKEIAYYEDGKQQYSYTVNKEKIFFDKDGKAVWTNLYKNGKPFGEHKTFNLESDGVLRAYISKEYDNNGKEISSTWYNKDGSYTKTYFRNGLKNGKRIEMKNGSENVTYYYKDKLVTEAEYKDLMSKEKK